MIKKCKLIYNVFVSNGLYVGITSLLILNAVNIVISMYLLALKDARFTGRPSQILTFTVNCEFIVILCMSALNYIL